jgi:hypothetical protein
VRLDGRPLFVCDSIKIPKSGQRMPSVKAMHQESSGNTKPSYIMGHFWNTICLLAGSSSHCFAIPLRFLIHDGLKRSPSEKATLSDKAAAMLLDTVSQDALVVADCAYSCRKILDALVRAGLRYIGCVRTNTVAWLPAPERAQKPGRGRPRKYGDKVKRNDLYKQKSLFQEASVQTYSELEDIRYHCVEL